MAYTTIDDPTIYFNTKLYTGNGGTGTGQTGIGFQPDWVWIKARAGTQGTQSHNLFDSVRGEGKYLFSDSNDAESTDTNRLTSFDSDGFTVGSNNAVNASSTTYVAWNWLAGGSASANSDGGTSSSVSVNTTAGFSIVNWAGSSSASVQTIGHGLGTTPHWILTKNRGAGSSITAWVNYHHRIDLSTPEDFTIYMNNTDARVDNAVHGDTKPTSSVFSFNTGTDDQNYISYCFVQKKGFSKFGSYKGNGQGAGDGVFVYTGFLPSYVMVKTTTDAGYNWVIYDNKRVGFNPDNDTLNANETRVEQTTGFGHIDMLSNGFKIRASTNDTNRNANVFIYMAFAESPFVTSKGVPTTAR